MIAWIKSLRLPICFLAGLLAVASFRIANMNVPWIEVIAVFFVACAIMLQNDWRDRRHDGHKGKTLAIQHQEAFLALLLTFWTVSCGLILVAITRDSNIGIALVTMAFVGLIYSEVRRIPLAPIILVALTSGSPALLPIVAGAHEGNAWLVFLSATLIIFGREIIKDIDDERIDNGYKWTIPLVLGSKRARGIAAVAIVIGLAVAVRVSLMILPASLLAMVGVVLLIRGSHPSASRIYLDVGAALTVLTFVILRG